MPGAAGRLRQLGTRTFFGGVSMKKAMRWILPLLLICGTGALFAQSTNSGDIRGTVTDSSGAVIPGVTVAVKNVSTGVTSTVTTNSAGVYDTGSIVAGSYEV